MASSHRVEALRGVELPDGADCLYVPSQYEKSTDPRVTDATQLMGRRIEPIPPTWRDLWAILRGRYQPRLRVVGVLNVQATDYTLRKVWTGDRLESMLADSPPLTRIDGRTCAICGKSLVGYAPHARYCSGACRMRGHRGVGPPQQRSCVICGVTLESKSAKARYCSQRCQKRGWRQAQRVKP